MDGLYHEPRSLWSIANVASNVIGNQRLQLPRRHFYNGERHPITINRIALCGVNYLLQGAPTVIGADGFNETMAVISRCRIKISSPQRFHWTSKNFVLDASMAPLPTAEPPTGLFPGDAGEVVTYLPNALWGQSMLKLDYPLIVPSRGAVQWDLSAHTPFPGTGEGEPAESAAVTAWMLYQQVGGLFSGSARSKQVPLLPFVGGITELNPEERWPYPPDSYGVGAPVGIPTSDNWWPGASSFPAGRGNVQTPGQQGFIAQQAARDGSSEISDLRVSIDQRLYDQRLVEQFGATARPSPLSTRTGTRIRTQGTGSQNYWWRPGAPLALVFDHITPALVLRLTDPITLSPQDQLDVEMEFPPVPDGQSTTYHVGVSFNGFATIEG